MPRKMTNGDTTVNVVAHFMTRNMWEYYLLEKPDKDGIALALVEGDYQEIGDVSIPEIQEFVFLATKDLSDLMPAPNWEWCD